MQDDKSAGAHGSGAPVLDYRTAAAPVGPSKPAYWIGWVLSVMVVGLMFFSGYAKLSKQTQAVEGFKKSQYPDGAMMWIGIAEVSCAAIYLIPRTSVLGAILVAAYLGGATNYHVRLGEPFWFPPLMGVLAWLGIALRERRIWKLVPLRKATA